MHVQRSFRAIPHRSEVVKSKAVKLIGIAVIVSGLFAVSSYAATVATGAVIPAVATPGSKVMIHTGVSNLTQTNRAVTVTLTVSNPGTCVTGHLPTHAGAMAFDLRHGETRLGDLSLDIPPSACSGTYGVTVTVKNSSGTVLATHTSKFTVTVPGP
jgi:hypothetical protein